MTVRYLDVVRGQFSLDGTVLNPGLRRVLETSEGIVPMAHTAYAVDDYYVVNGRPVRAGPLGIDAVVEANKGELIASMSAPELLHADLDPVSRWLPFLGTYDDPTQWKAVDGSAPFSLWTEYTTPVLDTAYEYVRGGRLLNAQAMRLDGEDYFYADQIRWAASSVAMLVVAVMHTPDDESYGVLETYPFGEDEARVNRAFFGLRYTSDGLMSVSANGRLSEVQTSSQGVRTGVPIIVGFLLTGARKLHMAVSDRSLKIVPSKLPTDHPQQALLYLGRSPGQDQSIASMDIMDVSYYEGLSLHDFTAKAALLDAMYGVGQ